MKKNFFAAALLTLVLATSFSTLAYARSSSNPATAGVPQMPRIFANARFAYVAAYDGDQFNPNLLPEDREAIARVQNAIQKWGKLTIVYRAQDADVILMVQSRPSEDVLAVYDAHRGDQASPPSDTYLWRVMGRGGLQKDEAPLLSQFETAWTNMAR